MGETVHRVGETDNHCTGWYENRWHNHYTGWVKQSLCRMGDTSDVHCTGWVKQSLCSMGDASDAHCTEWVKQSLYIHSGWRSHVMTRAERVKHSSPWSGSQSTHGVGCLDRLLYGFRSVLEKSQPSNLEPGNNLFLFSPDAVIFSQIRTGLHIYICKKSTCLMRIFPPASFIHEARENRCVVNLSENGRGRAIALRAALSHYDLLALFHVSAILGCRLSPFDISLQVVFASFLSFLFVCFVFRRFFSLSRHTFFFF